MHKAYMDELQMECSEAWDYLNKIPKKQCCRSEFEYHSKCEHISNNFSESFNAWLGKKLRKKPLTIFIEKYHFMVMTLIFERKKLAEKWAADVYVPRCCRTIKTMRQHVNEFKIYGADVGHMYCVEHSKSQERWTVDIEAETCNCFVWDLTGIPCIHAACVIFQNKFRIGE